MAKLPAWNSGQPTWIDNGSGVMVPSWAEDPCTCCGGGQCCEQGWPTRTVTISGLDGCCTSLNGSYVCPFIGSSCDATICTCQWEYTEEVNICDGTYTLSAGASLTQRISDGAKVYVFGVTVGVFGTTVVFVRRGSSPFSLSLLNGCFSGTQFIDRNNAVSGCFLSADVSIS